MKSTEFLFLMKGSKSAFLYKKISFTNLKEGVEGSYYSTTKIGGF